jgi:hypothetical protein
MGARPHAINLQFGKGTAPDQDIIPPPPSPALPPARSLAPAMPCVNKTFQIIPSSLGSHSEISGT